MSDKPTKGAKKIPISILLVGTFQVAAGLWVILGMTISNEWHLITTLLAVAYGALGAGLLAMLEWARFAGVVVHATILPLLLWRVAYVGEARLGAADQVAITMVIFYVLTRPHIRARFQGGSYSSVH